MASERVAIPSPRYKWHIATCGVNFWGQLGVGSTTRKTEIFGRFPVTTAAVAAAQRAAERKRKAEEDAALVAAEGRGGAHRYNETGPLMGEVVEEEWLDDSTNSVPVTQVACGVHSTTVLTAEGRVYHWGTLYTQPTEHPAPVFFGADTTAFENRIVQVACGRKHTLALSASGAVYSWGCGGHGRLGHGVEKDEMRPRLVAALASAGLDDRFRVTRLGAGGAHSAAILASGAVLMWGANRYSQCGGKACRARVKPGALSAPAAVDTMIVDLVAGRHHTAMLSSDGHVFTWGANSGGRLGHTLAETTGTCKQPKRLAAFRRAPVSQIAAGDFHTLALTRDGVCYSWGHGTEGQCGTGKLFHVRTPKPVPGLLPSVIGQRVVYIAAGSSHSVAITSRGSLYTWGSTDGGLGLGGVIDGDYRPDMMDPVPDPEANARAPPPATPLKFDSSGARACPSFLAGDLVLVPSIVTSMAAYHTVTVAAGACHTVVVSRERIARHGDDADGDSAYGKHTPTASSGSRAAAVYADEKGSAPRLVDAAAGGGDGDSWGGARGAGSGAGAGARAASAEARSKHASEDADTAGGDTLEEVPRSGAPYMTPSGTLAFTEAADTPDAAWQTVWESTVPVIPKEEPVTAADMADDVAQFLRFCRYGRFHDVEDMIQAGIPLHVADEHGNTPLLVAAQTNQKRVLRMLLDSGADPNAQNVSARALRCVCGRCSVSWTSSHVI